MPEIIWDSNDAEQATGGSSTKNWQASGVCIDSRKIQKGDLFIAIIGENQDGHKYVASALEKGAAAAIVNFVPEDVAQDAPLLVVEDTTEALWDLAKFSRERMKAKVIAVTGSVGKTSTKEMLAAALSGQGRVYYTEGNLNNHYGLPLSMSRVVKDTNYCVFELGMNHPGEISPLSVLAQPDVAIITTVEAVHLQYFESVEQIADAKAEIFDGVKTGGAVILNRDNPHFEKLKALAASKGIERKFCFGRAQKSDFKLLEYKDSLEGGEVKVVCKDRELTYKIGIAGEHQALNSLAVLAAIDSVGGDIKKAAKQFENFSAKDGRGKRYHLNGITIIDDCYNASPASVSAALKVLGGVKKHCGGRAVAILGDMFELGDDASQMHAALQKKLVDNDIDVLFAAGTIIKSLYDSCAESMRGGFESSSQVLAPVAFANLKEGDIVLIKGSRGMKMENVLNHILQEGQKKNAV